MIIVDDEEMADVIKRGLRDDPETTSALLALMVSGCEQIDRFERRMEFARNAPFNDNASPEAFEQAMDEARESFGNLIEIFAEVLDIATGASAASEA